MNMGLAQYSIVPIRDQWGVLHDGNVNGEYATKESAFESAVAAASLAIRQGHEVHVSVPARDEDQAAIHARP
jgi:phosphotransferase system HPr-like phosphotransfer protein